MKLKTKIIFAAVAVMIITVIIILTQTTTKSYGQQLNMTQEHLKKEAYYLSKSINTWVNSHVTVLEAMDKRLIKKIPYQRMKFLTGLFHLITSLTSNHFLLFLRGQTKLSSPKAGFLHQTGTRIRATGM